MRVYRRQRRETDRSTHPFVKFLSNEMARQRAALAEAADNLDYWGGYVNANKARAALEGRT